MVETKEVTVYEVGPRDGLQNEKTLVPTDLKISLINKLSETGLKFIESASFVSPKWVPQMADSSDVMKGIKRKKGVEYPVLVPNLKGLERALECEVKVIAVFAAASESFSQKNTNCSIQESLERFTEIISMANRNNVAVRGYVSCVLGCPYEGDIDPGKVAEVSKQLYDMGCYELSLGDTIGIGTPEGTRLLIDELTKSIPVNQLALHCHDTYGRALDNIEVGLEMGIRVIDSAIAGLGGCPYAEGASGNVSTIKVLDLLSKLGFSTGIDLEKIKQASKFVTETLNDPELLTREAI